MRGGQARHVDGLPVMRDHPLHEFDIMHGVERASGDRDVTMIAHVHPRHGPLEPEQRRRAGQASTRASARGEEVRWRWGEGDSQVYRRTVYGKKNRRKVGCIHWGRGPYPVSY